MQIRPSSLMMAVSMAILTAGVFPACERQPVTTNAHEAGIMNHPLADADLSILGDQSKGKGRTGSTGGSAAVTAAPTTGAATFAAGGPEAAVPAKPDFSTPKNALKSFFAVAPTSKLDDLKVFFATPANDDEKDLLNTGWSDDILGFPLLAAIKEKFPDQSAKSPLAMMMDMAKTTIDSSTEEINGDKATVKPTGAGVMGQPVDFVKVGPDWKMVIEEGGLLHKHDDNQKAAFMAMSDVFTNAIADIKAGKYASADEAMKAVDAARQDVRKKFNLAPSDAPPAPAPADAPPAPARSPAAPAPAPPATPPA
ncbi:MAG TPA: hypothetical protein VGN88_08715 [Phycisphaerae bacterium]